MKIVVTHTSPDMDAITSVWLVKKFLPNWADASVKFVPAGDRISARSLSHVSDDARLRNSENQSLNSSSLSKSRIQSGTNPTFSSSESGQAPRVDPIEIIDGDEVIHVDTGLGPLDHHQTASDKVCGASLTFDFVKEHISKHDVEAVNRMVKVIVDVDHFKEVYRKDPLEDYHEFDVAAVLDGLKLQIPAQDDYYCEFIIKCLDAVLHEFENRIWAEKEIKENGKKFETKFGHGMGFETINDSVVKLSQKMGYAIVARKDPRKGYVRIKVRPDSKIDLTLAYEKLRKIDPSATWYLHISKKMLLNGSVKNPKMRPTKLTIDEIIRVLEKI